MVDGEPLVAGERRMSRLNPGDFEVLESPSTGYRRAIDATAPGVPKGDETYAQFSGELRAALAALGGDAPPAGGGPAPDTNTYSYLKARLAGGALAGTTDAQFRSVLTALFGTDSLGRVNIEAVELKPVIDTEDDFLSHLLAGDVDPNTGLIADPTPPFGLYPANLNHVGPLGNPFADLP
jgi:hypothetical protein